MLLGGDLVVQPAWNGVSFATTGVIFDVSWPVTSYKRLEVRRKVLWEVDACSARMA